MIQLLEDLFAKNLIKPFHNKSIQSLLIFFFFYHGLSSVFGVLGSKIPKIFFSGFPDYGFPNTIINSIFLSPIFEELIFFGLPYYLLQNHYLLAILGSLWSIVHLLVTANGPGGYLNMTLFLATIPILLFNIRAWRSGKGWFSIVTHVFWNGFTFYYNCTFGIQCLAFSVKNEFEFPGFVLFFGLVLFLIAVTMAVYQSHNEKKLQDKHEY